jgi:hypothetical protein
MLYTLRSSMRSVTLTALKRPGNVLRRTTPEPDVSTLTEATANDGRGESCAAARCAADDIDPTAISDTTKRTAPACLGIRPPPFRHRSRKVCYFFVRPKTKYLEGGVNGPCRARGASPMHPAVS